jgi:hypothetical protein
VIGLCFLFGVLPAASRGAEVPAKLAKREAEVKSV